MALSTSPQGRGRSESPIREGILRMTRIHSLTIAAITLTLATACSDNTSAPTDQGQQPLTPAFAVHFVGARSCTQSGDNLLCSFKVAGLGNISSATVTITAPFSCTKTNGGEQFVQPGGLASSSQQGVPVSNGQITLTNFQVTGGHCPDAFGATF